MMPTARRTREQFDDWARKQTISAEWRLVDSEWSEIGKPVIEHGLKSDLVIVIQVDRDRDSGIETDLQNRW